MTEPLFVFCPVCRRHVKRGPDSTLAVTLRRHKAHVHGDLEAVRAVAAERTGWESWMTGLVGYAGAGWYCADHDRFHAMNGYCQQRAEQRGLTRNDGQGLANNGPGMAREWPVVSSGKDISEAGS